MNISKSKYVAFTNCQKQFWLECHKGELAVYNNASYTVFRQGHSVGELALELFDSVVDVTTKNENGSLDHSAMIQKTNINIDKSAIAEASVGVDGLYCQVDILKNNNDGTYDIYEVKSSGYIKDYYYRDIAFQKFVLEKAGFSINKCFLVHVNKFYVRKGNINPKKFLKVCDVTHKLCDYLSDLPINIASAKELIKEKNEPIIRLNKGCHSDNACPFKSYCFKELSEPSVFNLYNADFNKKLKLFNSGIVSFDDIAKGLEVLKEQKIKLSEKQLRQVDHCLNKQPIYVDKPSVNEFLTKVKFPIYFLDFETYYGAFPLFDGNSPFDQTPFQYSIHILHKDGKMDKKDFLAVGDCDPSFDLAKQLIEDIKNDGGSVVTYNAKFEKGVLSRLIKRFTAFGCNLTDIIERLVDLRDVFSKGYVYNKDMGGSFSIKSVLPALFPDKKEFNYNNLSLVHSGTEASESFAMLLKMEGKLMEETRKSLIEYCSLDTLAMVEIYKKLIELCK